MTQKAKYATLEEMQGMEFGVHGSRVIKVNGVNLEVEYLGNSNVGGWAAVFRDEAGNMVDWDRLDVAEAREFGLI